MNWTGAQVLSATCRLSTQVIVMHMESVHLSLSHSMQVDVRPCFAPVAKSIIVCGAGVPGGKHKDDNLATHAHVFDCQKAPHDKSKILTDSVLFPVGNSEFDTSDFLHAFCKIQRLEILALQVQKGLCICIFGVYTCYTLRLANLVCYRLVL